MFPHIWLTTPTTEEYRAKKKARGLCRIWRCRRPKAHRRSTCEVCKSRLFRLANPMHYAWVCLAASARKRKIGFEITFEQFEKFCAETGYLQKKGTDPESATVNRIKSWLPYTIDNIEIMSHHDNVSRKFDTPPVEGEPY